MHLTPDSKTVHSFKYDVDARELTVQFKSGGTYVYSGVEAEHYHGLKTTDSPGSYLHEHIKGGNYSYQRLGN